jgi:hypothetical protein
MQLTGATEKEEEYEESYEIQNPIWDWEKVTDWKKRIAKYTDQQKKFYTDMMPKVQEFKGVFTSENGWSTLVDSPSDQVKIE